MAMNALRIAAKESKIMKFVLGGFIFLAVGGLVFTDVQGYFRGGLPNTTVAQIGDTELYIQDFDRDLRGFLQQTQMTPKEALDAGLIHAYLNNRINTFLISKVAQELDIQASPQAIAQQIKEVFQDASKDDITMLLRARGITEKQMVATLQDQIKSRVVTEAYQAISNYAPSDIIKAYTRFHQERRSGKIFTFSAQKLAKDITITDDDIEAYYHLNKDNYRIPEKRVFMIGKMTADQVKSSLPKITEEDIRAEYDVRISDYTVPEKRTIAQAVLNDPDQAQSVYEEALKGTPLKTALKNITQSDKGFRNSESYEKNGLLSDLSDKAFAEDVKKGDILPHVKTGIGWHVLKVVSITPSRQKSLKEVRANIRKDIEKTTLYDALYEKIVETEDLIDSDASFDDIAKKTGLKTIETKSIVKGQRNALPDDITEIQDISPTIMEELFSLAEGSATYPVELDENSYAIVGVHTITPENHKTLESVQKDIKKTLTQQRRHALASDELRRIAESLNSGEKKLTTVQKAYGGQTKSFKNIKRGNTKYDSQAIFNAPQEGYVLQMTDDSQLSLIYVTNIKTEKATNTKIPQSIYSDTRQKIHNIFDGLNSSFYRENTKVEINDALLQQHYGSDY